MFRIILFQEDFWRDSAFIALFKCSSLTFAWKVSIVGVILVRIFLHLDWVRRDTPYSVRMLKMRSRITPNTVSLRSVNFEGNKGIVGILVVSFNVNQNTLFSLTVIILLKRAFYGWNDIFIILSTGSLYLFHTHWN